MYKKEESYNTEITDSLKEKYQDILTEIGENPKRDGLLKTPERMAKAMQYLTHGYAIDPSHILKSAMFAEDYNQMVLVKDIELYSCASTTCCLSWQSTHCLHT